MKEDGLLVGYHFAKTGGTTILSNFRDCLGSQACYSFGYHAYQKRFLSSEPIINVDPERSAGVRVAFGHGVSDDTFGFFPGRDIHLFCAIRDPFTHAVSQYKHHVRTNTVGPRNMTFEDFYRKRKHNPFATIIVQQFPSLAGSDEAPLGSRVRDVLRNFRFVVSTDKLDEQTAHLYRFVGARVEAPRRRVYPEEIELGSITREMVIEQNQLDYELNATVCSYAPPAAADADEEQFGPFGYNAAEAKARIDQARARKNTDTILTGIDRQFVKQLVTTAYLPAARAKVLYDPESNSRLLRPILRQQVDFGDRVFASACFTNEGHVHLHHNQVERAVNAFTNASILDPRNERAKLGLARAQVLAGELKTAKELLSSVHDNGPAVDKLLKIVQKQQLIAADPNAMARQEKRRRRKLKKDAVI